MSYIAVGSLIIAPYEPDDYPTFVSNTGAYLGLPANDPLFDTDGYGTVTGGVIQLDNGRLCVTNLGNFQNGVFNADMTLRAVDPTENPGSIAGGYDNGFFYAMRNYPFGGAKRITKISSDTALVVGTWSTGETGSYSWTIAVTRDESYAYFSRGLHYPGFDPGVVADIKRLNLSTLAVTTFVVASTAIGSNSMFCLRDGTLMVAWADGTIVHYATDASVLHTYTRAGINAITPGLTDSSFWVRYNTPPEPSEWAQEITIATGALLHNFALPTGSPPAAHAGNATSTNWGITFAVVRVAIGTPPVAPGTPPTPVLVNSDPCCNTSKPGTDNPAPTAAGPVLPGFGWTPRCAGGGTVPSASDLTDSENWDV